jgi:hypothetical protein
MENDEPLPDDPEALRNLWLMDDPRVNAMLSKCAACGKALTEDDLKFGGGCRAYCSEECRGD